MIREPRRASTQQVSARPHLRKHTRGARAAPHSAPLASFAEGYQQKWVVVSFSIMGFILNLIFLGLIVEQIRVLLDSWRRTHGRIVENEHTVILGWTDKTLFLLGELAEMMTDSQKGGGIIVRG